MFSKNYVFTIYMGLFRTEQDTITGSRKDRANYYIGRSLGSDSMIQKVECSKDGSSNTVWVSSGNIDYMKSCEILINYDLMYAHQINFSNLGKFCDFNNLSFKNLHKSVSGDSSGHHCFFTDKKCEELRNINIQGNPNFNFIKNFKNINIKGHKCTFNSNFDELSFDENCHMNVFEVYIRNPKNILDAWCRLREYPKKTYFSDILEILGFNGNISNEIYGEVHIELNFEEHDSDEKIIFKTIGVIFMNNNIFISLKPTTNYFNFHNVRVGVYDVNVRDMSKDSFECMLNSFTYNNIKTFH